MATTLAGPSASHRRFAGANSRQPQLPVLVVGILVGALLHSVFQAAPSGDAAAFGLPALPRLWQASLPEARTGYPSASSSKFVSGRLARASSSSSAAAVGEVARPALIGVEAPAFTVKAVVDQEFVDVSLSDYRGKKYVVLFFYPLDFTFVCPTEIIAFSDRLDEFTDTDTEVLGVSVDSEYSHLAWVQMPRDDGGLGDIRFPLLSDLRKDLAKDYGVLAPDGTAYRGLFIIDKEGIVQHTLINNMPFGRNLDEVLRTLKAIQHVQANPDEVCPAAWQPGDRTMRPDPEGRKEYFEATMG